MLIESKVTNGGLADFKKKEKKTGRPHLPKSEREALKVKNASLVGWVLPSQVLQRIDKTPS